MNAYFFKMTKEEKDNILDQHKTIYDGYVTSYAQQPKEQPLYTQDFANDKEGITVSNKGVVTSYKNMGINEMRFDLSNRFIPQITLSNLEDCFFYWSNTALLEKQR